MCYEITFRTDGKVVLSIDADNEVEAFDEAEQFMCDADFGPLEDIQWEAVAMYDDNGNEIDTDKIQQQLDEIASSND